MSLMPLISRCPALARNETRFAYITDHEELGTDTYFFHEYYCTDSGCDCRRVVIIVSSISQGERPLATISYGWEEPDFYAKKSSLPEEQAILLCGPFLDPICPQSELAEPLLDFFLDMLDDDNYATRFERHYMAFRETEPASRKLRLYSPLEKAKRKAKRRR